MSAEPTASAEQADPPSQQGGTDVAGIQRRAVRALLTAQVLGSIAITAGIAMGGLIVEYSTGSTAMAGLAQAASTLGGALMAVPAARLAMARGRRPSLAVTYVVAALGAVLVVIGSVIEVPVVVLVGMLGFGAGTAASLQVRFAGLDLATPATRGRTLSVLMFAVTIGGLVGPNLSGPTGRWALSLGLPEFAGPFFVSISLFLLAAVAIGGMLRPDPLVVARRLASESAPDQPKVRMGVGAAIRYMLSTAGGRIGVLAVIGAHASMVAVMVMTPVHIGHAGHGLEVVGFVISAHVIGMYALSPVMGMLADRYGPRATVLLGALILLAACALSGLAPDSATVQLGVGLFLLGVGWSACMVGGSLLVSTSADIEHRPAIQGASDLLMGGCAALIATLSGVIVTSWSYGALAFIAAILVVPMLVALMIGGRREAATSE